MRERFSLSAKRNCISKTIRNGCNYRQDAAATYEVGLPCRLIQSAPLSHAGFHTNNTYDAEANQKQPKANYDVHV
jgi:hypothetical protein